MKKIQIKDGIMCFVSKLTDKLSRGKEFDEKIDSKTESYYIKKLWDLILLFISYIFLLIIKIYDFTVLNNYGHYNITNQITTYIYITFALTIIIICMIHFNKIKLYQKLLITLYTISITYKLFPLFSSFIIIKNDLGKGIDKFLLNTISLTTLIITLPFSIMNISNVIRKLYKDKLLNIVKYLFGLVSTIFILFFSGITVNSLIVIKELELDYTKIYLLLILFIFFLSSLIVKIIGNIFLEKHQKFNLSITIISSMISLALLITLATIFSVKVSFNILSNSLNNYILSYICISEIINILYMRSYNKKNELLDDEFNL